MRKLVIILFLAPLLMATQCESDEIVVSTVYIIQNDSNTNLIFITEEAGETVITVNQVIFLISDLTHQL